MTEAVTAYEIIEALRQRHVVSDWQPEWLCIEELPVGWRVRYIDFWAMHLWRSRNYLRIAYEIKVSRADFLHELRQPAKRAGALRLSNQFYFATPAGLVTPAEVPPEAGLIVLATDGQLRVVKKAPWREIPPPSLELFRVVASRTQRYWGELRRVQRERRSASRYNAELVDQLNALKAAAFGSPAYAPALDKAMQDHDTATGT